MPWPIHNKINGGHIKENAPVEANVKRTAANARNSHTPTLSTRFVPDAIIYAATLNDFNLMCRDRKLVWHSYVDATRVMAEAANAVEAKLLKTVRERVVQERATNWAIAHISGVNGKH